MSGPSSDPGFDERSRRLASFDPESVPGELAGVVVYLPRPRLFLRCKVEASRVRAEPARGFGAEFDSLLDAVGRSSQSGVLLDLATDLFALTANLLRRNYEISDREIEALVAIDVAAWRESAPQIPEPWDTVWRLANSLPPKSSATGSLPPA